MPGAHLDGQPRQCGATTVVEGQSTVFVNGKLWAVDNDPNTHEEGRLIAAHGKSVIIEGKAVIVHAPDTATIDLFGHPSGPVDTADGSGNVFAYGG